VVRIVDSVVNFNFISVEVQLICFCTVYFMGDIGWEEDKLKVHWSKIGFSGEIDPF
jgi:hypothetical protein